jgi:hypothetical protein
VFVDFTKAFDSLDREALWHWLMHCDTPDKCIAIIKNTYTNMQCKVIHDGQLTEAFDI